jgi:regulator of sigma E protease
MLPQPPLWLILIAFICALGPLVFFHELGHYLVARWLRIPAEAFSIGFGGEIAGWTDRQGTRWKIGWLPLGGYVRFVGDMSPASGPVDENAIAPEDRDRAFALRPVWQRFLVVLAGPIANFLLAIIIFAAFFATVGAPRTDNLVASVAPGGVAQHAGIRAGDRILSIADRETPSFEDISDFVVLRPGEQTTMVIERNGKLIRLPVTIGTTEERDRFGQRFRVGRLGIYGDARTYVRLPVTQLIPAATSYTYKLTRTMMEGLWQIVSGRRSAQDLGGPIKIAQYAGQGASLGLLPFVQLIALFSINLGFINLLPVPVLDGGHLFFYTIEAVRRRPLSAKALDWAFRGGLALILALLIFTTVNDLGSLGLWDRLQRLIG